MAVGAVVLGRIEGTTLGKLVVGTIVGLLVVGWNDGTILGVDVEGGTDGWLDVGAIDGTMDGGGRGVGCAVGAYVSPMSSGLQTPVGGDVSGFSPVWLITWK